MAKQVAIVMTEVFLRRLTPSLVPFVRRQHDFRILSIHRPIEELRALLSELNPSGLITEWLPNVTEALLELGLPTVIADTDIQYPGVSGWRACQNQSGFLRCMIRWGASCVVRADSWVFACRKRWL